MRWHLETRGKHWQGRFTHNVTRDNILIHLNYSLIPDQDVASVQRVEEELFGRYFGDTDSSDIRRSRRSDARKYNRPKPIRTTTTPLITEKAPRKPNPWGMINLPLHDPVLRYSSHHQLINLISTDSPSPLPVSSFWTPETRSEPRSSNG